MIDYSTYTKKKEDKNCSIYFPFRSQSHEVDEPLQTHFLIVVLHTKPGQHDLPKRPEHFLPPLAQLNNNLKSELLIIYIYYRIILIPFFTRNQIIVIGCSSGNAIYNDKYN